MSHLLCNIQLIYFEIFFGGFTPPDAQQLFLAVLCDGCGWGIQDASDPTWASLNTLPTVLSLRPLG